MRREIGRDECIKIHKSLDYMQKSCIIIKIEGEDEDRAGFFAKGRPACSS